MRYLGHIFWTGREIEKGNIIQVTLSPTAFDLARRALRERLKRYPFILEWDLRQDMTRFLEHYVTAARALKEVLSSASRSRYEQMLSQTFGNDLPYFLDEMIFLIDAKMIPREMVKPWIVSLEKEKTGFVSSVFSAVGISKTGLMGFGLAALAVYVGVTVALPKMVSPRQ